MANFFFFDLRVYFATFAFPGKRTWLRFGEIWNTFCLLSFNIFGDLFTLNVVLNACLARFPVLCDWAIKYACIILLTNLRE